MMGLIVFKILAVTAQRELQSHRTVAKVTVF
jgi:hypothetical protein